ncbi:M20/M25/M40 family metallo-hydrolase [Brumimicrobium glaciale]|uniref:M20/M25/M40 family metallo-hydrolase n=1 Tax=Brumimicrobium glaciale TaxID=200475 RepID=A0A4Q4KKU3_9FLAO|nr:M20/M25/M40 family metallo-hydrolase [Brumimicrobium glaciale]RYM33993.1 M20/M25/M40 family metallo-hydrolase [Brumimicrobium glaciale]
MLTKTVLLFLGILISFLTFGQEEKARRITEVLCSDSLYGRGYVNNGVNKAADFLSAEFQKAGLQPYFRNDSYFQSFQLDVNTFPGNVEVKADGEILKPGIDYLVDDASGSFEGELNLVEVDTSVLSQSHLLDPLVEQVRNGEKNGFYIDLTGMSPQATYSAVHQFNSLAVLGAVVYSTDQKFTWSVGRTQLKNPVLHVKSGKIDAKTVLNVKIEAEFIKNFESKNVVGYLPAKKKSRKAETIVFTAHYDHLGGMGTSPETYFPGANDNASGTAMLISMADYFVENPSQYNIVFIAFAGEEAGLVGSKYFVDSKSMNFSKIKFLLNLDIMGSGEDGITAVNGRIHKKEFDQLKAINEEKNYLSQVKSRAETANSDHYHFHVKGVPSFFIYTMGPNINYHDVHDTYEELTFAAYNNIVKLLVDFVEHL